MRRGARQRHSERNRTKWFDAKGTATRALTNDQHYKDEMSTKDHNETLVGIHFAIGVFLALGLVVSPWVIGHRERMQAMAIISAVLLPVALLMFSTAFALHRKKPLGRKLLGFANTLLCATIVLTISACSSLLYLPAVENRTKEKLIAEKRRCAPRDLTVTISCGQ